MISHTVASWRSGRLEPPLISSQAGTNQDASWKTHWIPLNLRALGSTIIPPPPPPPPPNGRKNWEAPVRNFVETHRKEYTDFRSVYSNLLSVILPKSGSLFYHHDPLQTLIYMAPRCFLSLPPWTDRLGIVVLCISVWHVHLGNKVVRAFRYFG